MTTPRWRREHKDLLCLAEYIWHIVKSAQKVDCNNLRSSQVQMCLFPHKWSSTSWPFATLATNSNLGISTDAVHQTYLEVLTQARINLFFKWARQETHLSKMLNFNSTTRSKKLSRRNFKGILMESHNVSLILSIRKYTAYFKEWDNH